jgi:hypothetical protein
VTTVTRVTSAAGLSQHARRSGSYNRQVESVP